MSRETRFAGLSSARLHCICKARASKCIYKIYCLLAKDNKVEILLVRFMAHVNFNNGTEPVSINMLNALFEIALGLLG